MGMFNPLTGNKPSFSFSFSFALSIQRAAAVRRHARLSSSHSWCRPKLLACGHGCAGSMTYRRLYAVQQMHSHSCTCNTYFRPRLLCLQHPVQAYPVPQPVLQPARFRDCPPPVHTRTSMPTQVLVSLIYPAIPPSSRSSNSVPHPRSTIRNNSLLMLVEVARRARSLRSQLTGYFAVYAQPLAPLF